jgi:hypothetical protein
MTDERIIAYLLKELPDEELERFEDECFAQESWPSRIELVEEDLIEDYLRDELTPEQSRHFERNYAITAARQERVTMTAALLRHVDESQAKAQAPVRVPQTETTWAERFRAFWSGQTWALRTGVALATMVIVVGIWWLAKPRTSPLQTFATLTLTNNISNRADGIRADKVSLPLKADALKISLLLPQPLPPAAGYRVELENEDGETKSLELAGQDSQSVSVLIPAAQLSRGQYALNLLLIRPDRTEMPISGGYFFTVE